MTRRDHRSVGELLLDADHTARDLLLDVGDLDAAAMLRTWPEVVQTAATLWSLPTRGSARCPRHGPHSAPDPMAQVAAMTAALHRGSRTAPVARPRTHRPATCRASPTASPGPPSSSTGTGAPGPARNAAVRADADAARTRIIHTLYITAHGMRLAVLAHTRAVEATVTPLGQDPRAGRPQRPPGPS